MGALKFGVGLFPTESLAKTIVLARLIDRLGYTHIWVGDSHLIWREAYVNMAAVALNTSRVKIGTGVTNPVTRHPSVVASAYATLEEWAPARFIVGIGLGDSSVETMGMRPARMSYFEESVAQMRALLAGQESELPTGKIHLKHPCRRKVPFYVAASGPKMLELAGRIADGVIMLVGVDRSGIERAKATVEIGAKASGRTLKDLHLALWVPCAVSDRAPSKDPVKAHVARALAHPQPFDLDEREQQVLEEIRRSYNYYQHMEQKASQAGVIPDWLVDKWAIAGSVDECKAKLKELKKSGINQVAIIPYGDRAETLKGFAKAAMG